MSDHALELSPEEPAPPHAQARQAEKHGSLFGGALTDEVLDSSRSVLKKHRGGGSTVGLQQWFTPPSASRLIADVVGRADAVLDPTAGAGSLLAPFAEAARYGIEIDGDHVRAAAPSDPAAADGDGPNADREGGADDAPVRYRAAWGDVQRIVPMLRAAGLKWPAVVANPPFGEDWRDAARTKTKNSTVLAYHWAQDLLSPYGQGAIVLGTKRLALELMPLPEAAGIYAVVDVTGPLFDGVALPCSIAFFVRPDNHTRPDPLRLSASRDDLAGLAYDVAAARTTRTNLVRRDADAGLPMAFRTVAMEARRRARADAEGKEALRGGYDVSLRGQKVVSLPHPYARLVLSQRKRRQEVEHLHGQNAGYFGQNPKSYRALAELEAEGVLSLSPELKARAERAIDEALRINTPLFRVRPHMRLGWLTDLDKIRCTKDDPGRGFLAGKEYDLRTESRAEEQVEDRIVEKRDGTPEKRKFTLIRRLLKITVGTHDNSGNRAHTFDESEESAAYLLEHFDLPDPGCVQSRHPELVEKNRRVLQDIQRDYGLVGTDLALKPFQLDHDSRLLVKRRGVLGHKQGLGKTYQLMTISKAEIRLGAAPQELFCVPQDLLLQWQAQREKFFGERFEVIGSPHDARRVAREIRENPEEPRSFITHFEALSRVGRKREMLPEAIVDPRKALLRRLDAYKQEKARAAGASAEEKRAQGAGAKDQDGPDPYARYSGDEQIVSAPVTTRDACPKCAADTDAGWNGEVCTAQKYCATHGRGCEHGGEGIGCVRKGCGYVHVRLRVKPAASHLTKAFRGGVKCVDELTEISGDSQKSEALRALARGTKRQGGAHNYGGTGTPQKNFAKDTFWAFWWAFGGSSVAFPYGYDGQQRYAEEFNVQEVMHGRREDGEEHLKVRTKTLPILTNVSQFWRITQPSISRCRKEQTGESLVPLTYHPIEVPMGALQQKMHAFWLQNFPDYFAWLYPEHPLVREGLVEKWAAGLGQRWRLEAAATMPGWDAPTHDWPEARAELGEPSNWTPAMLKLLETVLERAGLGEKVLVGSCLKDLGPFVAGALAEKGVRANHITEVRGEGANRTTATKSPKKRARAVREFAEGDAQVLCAGVQALKLGHSLEAASSVVLLGLPDSWFVLDQFVERVHRLTSKKPVNIYVILPRGSIAQTKWDVLQKKGDSSDLAFDGEFLPREEKPVNWNEELREMRRRGIGLKATEDLVPEEEIAAAWQRIPHLLPSLTPARASTANVPRAVHVPAATSGAVSEFALGPFEEVSLFDPAPFETEAPARKARRRRAA